jgi:hypothetical protein
MPQPALAVVELAGGCIVPSMPAGGVCVPSVPVLLVSAAMPAAAGADAALPEPGFVPAPPFVSKPTGAGVASLPAFVPLAAEFVALVLAGVPSPEAELAGVAALLVDARGSESVPWKGGAGCPDALESEQATAPDATQPTSTNREVFTAFRVPNAPAEVMPIARQRSPIRVRFRCSFVRKRQSYAPP